MILKGNKVPVTVKFPVGNAINDEAWCDIVPMDASQILFGRPWLYEKDEEEYRNQEKIGFLDCGHEYHAGCLKKWLLVKNVCPICKAPAMTPK
ncbi:putative E3 ubiquitin-protein ligase ZFP1 [Vitis vinifera]|uniref:RING-type E3 ubiquitin transferase n=1 Tax=Vitis vinifera TaxID=29760 RepID=A0A438E5P9_VITVI|nr:putative E3 ubiquitin-protein ligase ZFP1 [Vitis vinifera]RVX03919.1 putative E3 ubiquitin-protein ligase ZFP1 [Vitis vinifera]